MTPARLNREMKSFCDDFRPIRRILRDIRATSAGQMDQVDYFFFLPDVPASIIGKRVTYNELVGAATTPAQKR